MEVEDKIYKIVKAIGEKKGKDVAILDLRKISAFCDYFIICTMEIPLHGRAIADEIDFVLSREGVYPLGIEGYEDSEWILLDYGDIVVHIFTESARKLYDLERLWSDAEFVISKLED
ncbi:MAG: ribosome silencing factor [Thermosulfidibacteraceae bacterium]|jgi:ribosome-associated protein